MARTQKEAINWIKNAVGKGFDTDGMYGFQCKDLVNAYANYLGLPVKAGNAKSLDSPSRGWKKVNTPQPGDIFVMDYWFQGTNYGHTGLVESVGNGVVNTVDQNWYNANLTRGSKAARVQHPQSNVRFYRPTFAKAPAPAPKPSAPKKQWVTVKNPVAYVRKQPNSKAPLAGTRILPKGTRFRITGEVKGEKVAGIDKWGKSERGNYVWSGAYKK